MKKREIFTQWLHNLLLHLTQIWPIQFVRQRCTEDVRLDWIEIRRKLHFYLTEYRAWIIVLIVVPISFLYDLQYRFRSWIVWLFLSAPTLHDLRVQRIQQQVRRWNQNGRRKKMCTARPTWASMSTRVSTFKKDCEQIELNLNDILTVDTDLRTVRVEPYVNMGQITDHLNRIGWTLALTVEMEDLTVGGLLMGIGLENNSHRYGLFHEICSAYEIVTADGELVRATANQNYDLFRALPASHGTIGLLVAAELAIVPCRPWVRVDYIPCYSQDELQTRLFDLTHDLAHGPDFVEATVYSRERSVIFAADFCDPPTWWQWLTSANSLNLWYKAWFYKHVESHLEWGRRTEYVPTRHWFHRHTRSIFWELEDLIPFGNRWWYRWTWAALGPPKVSLLKAFWTPEVRYDLLYRHAVQDILVPFEFLHKTIDKFDEFFGIYPLLLYPVRMFAHQSEGIVRNSRKCIDNDPTKGEMYFDLGVYGVPRAVRQGLPFDGPKIGRQFGQFAIEHRGFQLLYADVFITKDEFEQMFNLDLYDRVRKQYGAVDAFPHVWDKIKPQTEID